MIALIRGYWNTIHAGDIRQEAILSEVARASQRLDECYARLEAAVQAIEKRWEAADRPAPICKLNG